MTAREWLWPVNAAATVVTGAAAIAQPVTMLSAPCDMPCDPHGYVAIAVPEPETGLTSSHVEVLASMK
ncbi:hypothetical protein [Kribbella sp. HUAS MG21]|uniref:Secreted protein n=1 Tax=Kribbella sp. HUAS MG21 TaxID=3160966 RepID=A0AAU7TK79_9ACTN